MKTWIMNAWIPTVSKRQSEIFNSKQKLVICRGGRSFGKTDFATALSPTLCRFRAMPWTLSKARKSAKCWISGAIIETGEMCWRPVSNSRDRYRRISQLGMHTKLQ